MRRHGSAAAALAASSLSLSLNINARMIPPFAPINGDPIRLLAVFPLAEFAVAAGASRNISIPQAFAVGTAFSFPQLFWRKRKRTFRDVVMFPEDATSIVIKRYAPFNVV
jgi:hypothetical protein